MKIAVDFDGTIVENRFPGIGKPKLFAFETLQALQKKGHDLILWTYRSGSKLDEAVAFCQEHGIEFYAVNKNFPEEKEDERVSRKIAADIYIDDRNLGGFPGWSEVWKMLNPEVYQDDINLGKNYKRRRGWLKRLFSRMLLLLMVTGVVSCTANQKEEKSQRQAPEKKEKPKYEKVVAFRAKETKELYTTGQEIGFQLEWPDTVGIDSMKTYANTRLKGSFYEPVQELAIPTADLPVGTNTFKVEVWLDNGRQENHYQTLRLKSDISPEKLDCRIVRTLDHDPTAFTQGLYYEEGYIYEGTGKRGASSLRKVDLETGELVSSLALPAEYFGEGITGYGDKIIQLTWTSRTGFIYDKESFSLINKVRYPTEGWGLTTDGRKLIMSDGSATIYFLNPNFNETGRIKVYDDQGPVRMLNELEYVNGKVYANVYQQDYIISFSPESGKVLEKIDCSKLVPEKYKNSRENVLNGIAYDPESQMFFLTGKRWSKMYQVELVE
jgi:glutamine cyclotransferase/hydroxymethylpyrimidine pyrophosphatase-like HAD family hydrolase